jgi:hypothetical protein
MEKLPIPETLYEILQDYLGSNQDELILQIKKFETLDAIACFVTHDFDCSDDRDQRGFNFILHSDDQITLLLVDEDEVDDEDCDKYPEL